MIRAKQSLVGKLNNAIKKIYPELEDINIIPTEEEQNFKSEKYGYKNVKVKKIPDEYIVPAGDVEINSNGTYDVREKENAVVNIPEKQLGTKTITANGTYNANEDNLDGYSSVDVQTSGVDINDYFTTEVNASNSSSFGTNHLIKKTPTITINSDVNALRQLFYNTRGIKELNIINNSVAYDAAYMFNSCAELQKVTISDTSKITDMSNMFGGCQKLIFAPQMNTSKVRNMSYIFSDCKSFTEIPLYDTINVTDMSSMFSGCTNLKTIPLFNTESVKNISNMFSSCEKLESIPGFNFSSAVNTGNLFPNCKKLKTIPEIDTTKFTTLNYWFAYCESLENIPKLNASSSIQVAGMFNGKKDYFTDFGGLEDLGNAYSTTNNANYSNYRLDLSTCSNLTERSLINVLTNLFDIKTKGCKVQTVTLGSTNLAKLTSEAGQQALIQAQNYGWTIN